MTFDKEGKLESIITQHTLHWRQNGSRFCILAHSVRELHCYFLRASKELCMYLLEQRAMAPFTLSSGGNATLYYLLTWLPACLLKNSQKCISQQPAQWWLIFASQAWQITINHKNLTCNFDLCQILCVVFPSHLSLSNWKFSHLDYLTNFNFWLHKTTGNEAKFVCRE